MVYEEYLNLLDELKTSSSEALRDKIINSNLSENLRSMAEPKVIDTIKIKYGNTINRIIREMDNMFRDNYVFEQQLINFKKEVLFIYSLTDIKELSDESRESFKKTIKEETEKIYNILEQKANELDISGNLALSVRNSKIIWRD
jgi:ATP-dependent RNA circularization protein (DNA/RNA ligase family)